MPPFYPPLQPYDQGLLNAGDDQRIYWETCGNPQGKPALVLHGGPGSGATAGWRRYFNPEAYRVVLFDQRGCGRSTPHASDPSVPLIDNTTWHLIRDIEKVREHLRIDRWLLLGGSWGVTLGLAYAEEYPDRVSEAVFFSITTTSDREVQWATRGVGSFFPEAWAKFRDGVPPGMRDGNLATAYAQLLASPDFQIRERAARDWTDWEAALVASHPDSPPPSRFQDPRFRMAFARLVTHYWSHNAWLEDGILLRRAARLSSIPAVLLHGRLDLSSPPDSARELAQHWPGSRLQLLDGAGHGVGSEMDASIVAATDRFAGLRRFTQAR